MSQDPARRPAARPRSVRPWHQRPATRLGAVVAVVLALAAGAAAVAARSAPDAPDSAVVIATATPDSPADGPAATAVLPPLLLRPSPTATATVQPAPEPTREPLLVDLRPAQVGNGETMLVWVSAPGAAAVTLDFRGATQALLPAGTVFWGVVGVPLDAAPGGATLTVTAASSDGTVLEVAEATYEVVPIERPVDRVMLTPDQASVLTPEAEQQEREVRALLFARFDPGRRWATLFQRPAAGVITTQFGQGRSYNDGPVVSPHTGVDLAAEAGSPVRAPAPARVQWVGETPIRGLSVVLDHGAGVKTGFHHLQSVAVQEGDAVQTGDLLGAMGESGLATGPHLHWELTVWGVNVDPLTWTLRDFTP